MRSDTFADLYGIDSIDSFAGPATMSRAGFWPTQHRTKASLTPAKAKKSQNILHIPHVAMVYAPKGRPPPAGISTLSRSVLVFLTKRRSGL